MMDWFESLRTRLKNGGLTLRSKAKNTADIIALNSDVANSRTRIEELYGEIGAYIADSVFAGADKDMLQKCLDEEDVPMRTMEITGWRELYQKLLFLRSEEELIELTNRRITQIKNEGCCPNCGKKYKPGARFCSNCGTPLAQPAVECAESVVTEQKIEEPAQAAPAAEESVPEPAAQAAALEPAAQMMAPGSAAEEAVPEPAAEETAPEPAAEEAALEPATQMMAPEAVAEEAAPELAPKEAVPEPATEPGEQDAPRCGGESEQ